MPKDIVDLPVFGRDAFVRAESVNEEARTVDVHIRRLRKALQLDEHDRFVQTVRGAGYRFSLKVSAKES